MAGRRVVLDTNVIHAGLRSSRGASFRILQLTGRSLFRPAVSVPLILEYESVASRLIGITPLTAEDIDTVIDYLCSVSHHQEIFFAWRPALRDPADDFILELAVAADCELIVTFNPEDFRGSEEYAVHAIAPSNFLSLLEGTP